MAQDNDDTLRAMRLAARLAPYRSCAHALPPRQQEAKGDEVQQKIESDPQQQKNPSHFVCNC